MGIRPAAVSTTQIEQLQRELHLDSRALDALRSIDPTRRLLIWVPGTNEQEMPAGIRDAINGVMPGMQLMRVSYERSWNMRTSVPDGIRVLADVMRGIAWLKGHGARLPEEIFMAGHSQGCWVGTQVLASTAIDSSFIKRAVFFANPGINSVHAPGYGTLSRGPVGKVLELSNPSDPITIRPRDIEAGLDAVGGPEPWRRVRGAITTLLSDPRYAMSFVGWFLTLRLTGQGVNENPHDLDPHLYTHQARAGIMWLLRGRSALPEVADSVRGWRLPTPSVAAAR